MSWDNQLSSILSAADGSVAKMRERLGTHGKYSKGREDLYPVRELSRGPDLDPSPLPLPPLSQPSAALSPAVQWNDLAGLQAQLQSQSQMIESLSQNLRSMERDRLAQQRQMQTLQEEVRRLREKTDERERERGAERRGASPGVESRMEEWKREVTRELSSLRGHVNRTTSLGNLEESFSSKLRREEVDQLRREVDQLKTKLMRQEEDVFQQQSEARETRRQYERSCKTLESLTDSYRTHSFDLARTISQYQNTQQEVRDIRVTVSELKDEVRGLILRDRLPTPAAAPQRPALASAVAMETIPRKQPTGAAAVAAVSALVAGLDSDSDFSPTPSLGDVSSDDLDFSWPSKREPVQRRIKRRGNPTIRSPGSDLSDEESGLDDDDYGGVLGQLSDSPPELSLSDL
ncbi:ERC protein 2 [Alosa sapidissima]|uniref:ERC protein 2 n=1 Tax=Alosa sapidissima TaxID=34773 RepID=UPI001C08AC54|nr:ERC protein 2 [Alosa sapidissima]XP_041967530.1 ERC protein 2 [Alosa sapidissima]XP_041967531.1 ERC protein 2 [Alosa sapidissima]